MSQPYSGQFAVFCFWNMLRELHPDGVFKVLERRVVSTESSSPSKIENRRILKRSSSNSLSHLSHLHLVGSGMKGHSSSDSSMGSPKSPFHIQSSSAAVGVSKSLSRCNDQMMLDAAQQLSSDDTLDYQQEQQEEHHQQLCEQFTVLEVIVRLAGTPLTNLKLGELYTRLMSASESHVHEQ